MTHSGIMQGNAGLTLNSTALNVLAGAQLLSDGELAINGGAVTNAGSWQGNSLTFGVDSLDNSGFDKRALKPDRHGAQYAAKQRTDGKPGDAEPERRLSDQ